MATIQEINNEIDRIEAAKKAISDAMAEFGVDVPAGTLLDSYPQYVRQLGNGAGLFVAIYGQTTTAEIDEAFNAGKVILCQQESTFLLLTSIDSDGYMYFGNILGSSFCWARLTRGNNTWVYGIQVSELTSNRTQTLNNNSSATQYPSAKAVFDAIGKWGVINKNPNPVYGIIPISNIHLFEAAGAVYNAESGYFEIDGTNDITYNEMLQIYTQATVVGPLDPTQIRGN